MRLLKIAADCWISAAISFQQLEALNDDLIIALTHKVPWEANWCQLIQNSSRTFPWNSFFGFCFEGIECFKTLYFFWENVPYFWCWLGDWFSTISYELPFVYLENGYFVKLWLQSRSTKKSIKGGVKNPLLYFVFFVCKSSNIPVVYCNRVIFIKQMMIYRYMQFLMLFNVYDFCYF